MMQKKPKNIWAIWQSWDKPRFAPKRITILQDLVKLQLTKSPTVNLNTQLCIIFLRPRDFAALIFYGKA